MQSRENKVYSFMCIDTETTGTDPYKNSIIQLCAEYYEDGLLQSSFNVKCYPGNSVINLGALRVNKTPITKLVQNYSASTGNVLDSALKISYDRVDEYSMLINFLDFVLNIKKDNITILGHNVGFDVEFLKALLNKYAIEGFDRLFNYRVKDTAVLGQSLVDAGLLNVNRFGLSSLAESLGVSVDKTKTHDAMYDVQLTAQSYFRMMELLRNLNSGSVARSFTNITLG